MRLSQTFAHIIRAVEVMSQSMENEVGSRG